jgi:hypothetical protein
MCQRDGDAGEGNADLGLCELIQIFERLGVFKNSLHQRNGNFGLLHKVVLSILDFEPGLLLSRGTRIL